MKGLLLKDLYMSVKYCRVFFLAVICFIAVSFFNDDMLFIVYPSLIAGIVPLSLISYEERDKWTQYSGTLPYTRAQIVTGKYLISLIYGIPIYVLSLLASIVRALLNDGFSLENMFNTAAFLLISNLLCPTVLLPFAFKFGAEKGRIAFLTFMGALFAMGAILVGAGFQTVESVSEKWLSIVLCTVTVVLFLISWGISIRLFKKREL